MDILVIRDAFTQFEILYTIFRAYFTLQSFGASVRLQTSTQSVTAICHAEQLARCPQRGNAMQPPQISRAQIKKKKQSKIRRQRAVIDVSTYWLKSTKIVQFESNGRLCRSPHVQSAWGENLLW